MQSILGPKPTTYDEYIVWLAAHEKALQKQERKYPNEFPEDVLLALQADFKTIQSVRHEHINWEMQRIMPPGTKGWWNE